MISYGMLALAFNPTLPQPVQEFASGGQSAVECY